MNTLVFTLGEHRSQLTLKISTYPNGNLAIKLYEKDHGILIFWETLTTNLTGIRPDHCEMCIRDSREIARTQKVPMRRIKELLAEVHDVLLDICYG